MIIFLPLVFYVIQEGREPLNLNHSISINKSQETEEINGILAKEGSQEPTNL